MSVKLITGLKTTADIESQDDGARIYSTISSADRVLNVGSYWGYEIISNNCVRVKDGEALIQGRHVRQAPNTYTDLTINNGTQGKKRYDVIVLRYTKAIGTGIENVELAVVEGTPGTSATMPTLTTGDIFTGCTVHEMALWKVYINGLNISYITKMFTKLDGMENLYSSLSTSYTNLNTKVNGMETTAEITYYVSPTGNNNNSGTSSSSPFKTINYALSKIPKCLKHNVTINLASGFYYEDSDVLITGFFGGGTLSIVGNESDFANYIVTKRMVANKVLARLEFHGFSDGQEFSIQNTPNAAFYYCKAESNPTLDFAGFEVINSKVLATHCTAKNLKRGFYSHQGGELIVTSCYCNNCTYVWNVFDGGILYATYDTSSTGATSAMNIGRGGLFIDESGGSIGT